jgi:single-stranded-DNA-specific exonuclease
MLTTIDGVAKGSARSITNFNIYEALRRCEELLIHFGGHQAAAGLAIDVDKLDEFRIKFNEVVKETLIKDDLFPEIFIDSKIKFSEITPKFLRIIEILLLLVREICVPFSLQKMLLFQDFPGL